MAKRRAKSKGAAGSPGAPQAAPSEEAKARQLSGYAKRRQRKQREEDERRARGINAENRAKKAGPPPARAVRRATWATGILADLLFETISDNTLTAPEVRKQATDIASRLLRDGTQKAIYEETIADLEERLGIRPPEHADPADEQEPPETRSTPLRAGAGGPGAGREGNDRPPADLSPEEDGRDPS
jgi:hypothetical protein